MKLTAWIVIAVMLAGPFFAAGAAEQGQKTEAIKPALLVIDIQNQYLPMMQEKGKKMAMWYMNHIMTLFRDHGFPVILVYHTSDEFGPAPGTKEFQFPEYITIDPKDVRIVKKSPSAFKNTDLDKILKEKGINALFLTGLSAVGCVLATYWGAAERDYTVMMVKDALLSHDAAYTDMVEDICEVAGYDALTLILKGARASSK